MTETIHLGKVIITKSVKKDIDSMEILNALNRHKNRDWGKANTEQKLHNDNAIKNGKRIISVYESTDGIEFWILTESDRSFTKILLPDDVYKYGIRD